MDADEAIWRSLPFFATLIGLAGAVLPSVYSSLVTDESGADHAMAWMFFALAIGGFGSAGYWSWQVIKLREYTYPPNDAALLDYGKALSSYHAGQGLGAEEVDEAVRNDLRVFVIDEYARATTNNRRDNNAKLAARSRVLLWTTLGFLPALLSEATILTKRAWPGASPPRDDTGPRADGRRRSSSAEPERRSPRASISEACAAPIRARLGGGGLLSSPAEGGEAMSDEPSRTPPQRPEPPRPPEPERLKKNEKGPKRTS